MTNNGKDSEIPLHIRIFNFIRFFAFALFPPYLLFGIIEVVNKGSEYGWLYIGFSIFVTIQFLFWEYALSKINEGFFDDPIIKSILEERD